MKTAPKTRLLPLYQAYNNMFKICLGPIIQKEWTDSVLLERCTEEEKKKPIPPVPINFRNAALIKMLRAESPVVQEDVEVWRQAQRPIAEKKDEEDDNRPDDDEAIRFNRATAYQM